MKLQLGVFGTDEQIERALAGISNMEITKLSNTPSLDALEVFVSGMDSEIPVLVVYAAHTLLKGNPEGYVGEFEVLDADVLFACSAAYRLDDPTLNYYFWKYYPRGIGAYHYLNSEAFMGRAGKIKELLNQLKEEYPTDFSFHDLVTRFYVEHCLGAVQSSLSIKLDHNQDLFGSLDGRASVFKWPMLSWMHEDLFHRAEINRLAKKDRIHYRDRLWDVTFSKRRSFSFNGKLKSTPSIWLATGSEAYLQQVDARLQNKPKGKPFSVFIDSKLAYMSSLWMYFLAWLINRGEIRPFRIFRYTRNSNPEWEGTMQKFLGHLDRKEGFTFAHFNDGEMTFIKKYLEANHAETWFGRRQQSYNKDLGQRLSDALKLKRERYHVGIPCSTSHPKLRKLADTLVGGREGVVPAMSLHHNLRYYPNIIHHMKKRECYFVMNDHQKLDVLIRLGVEVKQENTIKVPFVNSYLLYDELKDRTFPEGAIVILICGMLAKIIIPVWFERNPKTTFLALGSSLDDFIQRTNTRFRLYPKEGLPLTCNIQPTKFFAFGWKKECPECWQMEEK